MKVLIYNNKAKDKDLIYSSKLINELNKFSIEYKIIEDNDLSTPTTADALFAIGGDGTVLFLAEFSCKNDIPIIGINAGNMGFLSEFEKNQISDAVKYLIDNKLIKDQRPMIKMIYKNKKYYALNDVFLHTYNQSLGNMAADFKVEINDNPVNKFKGDGALVTSPTGSSAYSFSLGGPLLLPDANVFMVMPIAPHSFNQRPMIFSKDSNCRISAISNADNVGIFVDGKLISTMNNNDYIDISCSSHNLTFLRKENFNFIKRVNEKFNIYGDKND